MHDPGREDPGLALSLAKLSKDPTGPTPIGVFRDVSRPVYGRGVGKPARALGGRARRAARRRRNLDDRLTNSRSAVSRVSVQPVR